MLNFAPRGPLCPQSHHHQASPEDESPPLTHAGAAAPFLSPSPTRQPLPRPAALFTPPTSGRKRQAPSRIEAFGPGLPPLSIPGGPAGEEAPPPPAGATPERGGAAAAAPGAPPQLPPVSLLSPSLVDMLHSPDADLFGGALRVLGWRMLGGRSLLQSVCCHAARLPTVVTQGLCAPR